MSSRFWVAGDTVTELAKPDRWIEWDFKHGHASMIALAGRPAEPSPPALYDQARRVDRRVRQPQRRNHAFAPPLSRP